MEQLCKRLLASLMFILMAPAGVPACAQQASQAKAARPDLNFATILYGAAY